jgi:hypothetical protein
LLERLDKCILYSRGKEDKMKRPLKILLLGILLLGIISLVCCANIRNSLAGIGSATLRDGMWIPVNPSLFKKNYTPKYRERGYYILPEHTQRELEKTMKIDLDGGDFRENSIYFIRHEIVDANDPCSSAAYNKALIFSFAGPNKREFIPDLFFKVYFDNKDVTDQVYYRSSIDNHIYGAFSVVQGIYKPQGYIDTEDKHAVKIILTGAGGRTYKREIPIEIPDIGLKEMKKAGFRTVLKGRKIEIEDETLIPLGRVIEYNPNKPESLNKNRSVFVPYDVYQSIEDQLKNVMGNIAAMPSDSLLFLKAGDQSEGKSNPPSLYFYLVAPYGDFVMSSVTSVFINDTDVTSSFAFNQFGREHLKFDLCSGFYYKPEFLDPSKEHSLKIVITPGDGNTYYREMKFTVPEAEIIMLQFEGLPFNQSSEKRTRILRDRLQFSLFTSSGKNEMQIVFSSQKPRHDNIPYVTINDEDILNPENWIIKIDNGKQLPKITNIELISGNWCIVYFDSDLPNVEMNVSVEIKLPNGVKSNICKFTVPVTY